MPFAGVQILRAAVQDGGRRRKRLSRRLRRRWLDEEESPEVVCGQRKEGDEFLGLDYFTLREKIIIEN